MNYSNIFQSERMSMRNPCKKCIVRAACSKQCNESKRYSRKASEVVTFFSLLLSSLILGPILIYLGMLSDQGVEWANMVVVIIWIVSFIIAIISQAPLDSEEQTSLFSNIIFAPIIALCMIFFFIARPYCKCESKHQRRIIF